MKAHDVRHIGNCTHCRRLGDKRSTLIAYRGELFHGCCLFSKIGNRVLKLPKTERAKLTVADVGIAIMRQLIEQDR